jgi:hypothetical protein
LRGIVGKDENREVLEQAPPDIFDAILGLLEFGLRPQAFASLPVRTGLLPLPPRQG